MNNIIGPINHGEWNAMLRLRSSINYMLSLKDDRSITIRKHNLLLRYFYDKHIHKVEQEAISA